MDIPVLLHKPGAAMAPPAGSNGTDGKIELAARRPQALHPNRDQVPLARRPDERMQLAAAGPHRRPGRTPPIGELQCIKVDGDVDAPGWLAADRDGGGKSHALANPARRGGRRQSDHGGRFVGLAVEANRIGTLGTTFEGANKSVERAKELAGALGTSIEPMYRSAPCAFLSKVGLPGARSLVSPEIPVRTAAVPDGSRFPRLSRPLG